MKITVETLVNNCPDQPNALVVTHDIKPPTYAPNDRTCGIMKSNGPRLSGTNYGDAQVQYGSIRYQMGFVMIPADADYDEIKAAKAKVKKNGENLIDEWCTHIREEVGQQVNNTIDLIRNGSHDAEFTDEYSGLEGDGETVTGWAPHPTEPGEMIEVTQSITGK